MPRAACNWSSAAQTRAKTTPSASSSTTLTSATASPTSTETAANTDMTTAHCHHCQSEKNPYKSSLILRSVLKLSWLFNCRTRIHPPLPHLKVFQRRILPGRRRQLLVLLSRRRLRSQLRVRHRRRLHQRQRIRLVDGAAILHRGRDRTGYSLG